MASPNKVVAICGSPRAGDSKQKSLTEKMLNTFLEGLGAESVEVFYPQQMDIAYCRGCYACWFKTPGICAIDDDMTIIRKTMDKSDLVILASPVYVDGFSAQAKIVLDRSIASLDPLIISDEKGHCRHAMLHHRSRKAILISTCGFSEIDNFDVIRQHFNAICRNLYWENAGEIVMAASGLGFVPQIYDEKFTAIYKAGEEISREGKVGAQTMDIISREIMKGEDYQEFLNPYFKKLRDQSG